MSTPTPPLGNPAEADAIRTIRTLVEAQDLRAAKAQLRQLQAGTDDATWAMIVEIANTLRFKTPTVAVTKLRNLWRHNEQFRPLIEACVPKSGERQYIPEPPPVRAETGPIVPRASKVSRDIDPDKRVAPENRRRSPRTKIIEDYEDSLDKNERDDPGVPREAPIIGRRDYDVEALTHVPTTLCVSCRLERAAIDRHTERAQAGRGDDGLCGECRSLGRSGLPELEPGHTLTDQLQVRLEYLAEHFPTDGRGIFRQEWRYADRHAQPIISAWVQTHTNPDPPRTPTPAPAVSGSFNDWCERCGEYRYMADRYNKLCIDCDPRNKQPAFQAGGIEAQHRRYAQEISGARQESGARPSSDTAQTKPTAEESRTRARASSPAESNDVAAKPDASVPSPDRRRKLIESAREKARATAQERRRAISRQPKTAARTRLQH
ncbi:hypothetical protein [Nocardia sp. NBC_01388]|uniref:hypothetical protein n=1 Tax=Nocardia sp. NBC_01388 TaxID=2903596 RepID=UPI00324486E8